MVETFENKWNGRNGTSVCVCVKKEAGIPIKVHCMYIYNMIIIFMYACLVQFLNFF